MTWSQSVMFDFRFAHDAPGWDNGRLVLAKPVLLDAERDADNQRTAFREEYPWTEDCRFLLTTFAPYTMETRDEGVRYSNVSANVLLRLGGQEMPMLMCGTYPASVMGSWPAHALRVPEDAPCPGYLDTPIFSDFKARRMGLVFERPVSGENVFVGCLFGGYVMSPVSENELEFRRQHAMTMDGVRAGLQNGTLKFLGGSTQSEQSKSVMTDGVASVESPLKLKRGV